MLGLGSCRFPDSGGNIAATALAAFQLEPLVVVCLVSVL